jgi:hypothetical protein
MAALRTRDFGEAMRTVELWSSRLPPGAGVERARLSDALARLGAIFYGRDDRRPPLESQWSDVISALRATRRERLAASATGRALPPLNPRLGT